MEFREDWDPDFIPNVAMDFNYLLNRQINRVAALITYARTREDLFIASRGVQVLQTLMTSKLAPNYQRELIKLDKKINDIKAHTKTAKWEQTELELMHAYINQKLRIIMKYGNYSGALGIKSVKDKVVKATYEGKE